MADTVTNRLAIKSFNGIGDLLFVTPTLRRIKEAYPDMHVTVNTNYPDLLADNPFVDEINTSRGGVFLGYPDPIHRKDPTCHHIISDFRIIRKKYELYDMRSPDLCPEIYLPRPPYTKNRNVVGVQVIHKNNWHSKKVWPKFADLAREPGLEPIPKVASITELVQTIATYRAVVCAEGGISHLAKAMGIPAIVIYGGFAKPTWNGYREQINLVNVRGCSFCYNPDKCQAVIERECMKAITLGEVLKAVDGLTKSKALENHNAMIFTKDDALIWCKGYGLDIGAGRNPLPGSRGVDNTDEENAYMIQQPTGSVDYVFSSHCIEHLDHPREALEEWARVIRPGGILYLYFPHSDYVPWRSASMPAHHKWDPTVHSVSEMIKDHFDIIEIVHKDEHFSQKIVARRRNE